MTSRHRRLRMTPQVRNLISETTVLPSQLIYPMFVTEGNNRETSISSMPGISSLSIDRLLQDVDLFADKGLGGILLFGVPDHKDDLGSSGYAENGVIQRALREVKREFPHLYVITDVCLCEYTSHGHCGVVHGNEIVNDETVELLIRMAVSHAEAGADMVAPSDMMDNRIGAIRKGLDAADFNNTPIMSYAVKYASALYGPFREAAGSTPSFGDRKSHQMNPANIREALREAESDIVEGADVLMVKPAGWYLDVIRELKVTMAAPVAAYQVSGEYSMIKAASHNGWIEEERAVWESLMGIRRAGADFIMTYFARDFALGKLGYRY